MSAGSNAAMLTGHPMNPQSLDWQGGALIRCICLGLVYCKVNRPKDPTMGRGSSSRHASTSGKTSVAPP